MFIERSYNVPIMSVCYIEPLNLFTVYNELHEYSLIAILDVMLLYAHSTNEVQSTTCLLYIRLIILILYVCGSNHDVRTNITLMISRS